MTDLYMDLEWFPNQEIYLIGYGYSIGTTTLLYDELLNMESILSMLKPVTGYIYFYGPDIGMLEKFTGLDIRNNYRCINLLKVFRDIMPGLPSYKLASFEEMFEIKRTQKQYKTNIWQLNKDWYDPYKKQQVLKYNYEDVANLIRLKNEIFRLYSVSEAYLDLVRMG
jgi:DNA polymerase elongation subunit (family B)